MGKVVVLNLNNGCVDSGYGHYNDLIWDWNIHSRVIKPPLSKAAGSCFCVMSIPASVAPPQIISTHK